MGLWSKGIHRVSNGKERLEDMYFDKHLINKIQDFITKMTNGDVHVNVKKDTIKLLSNGSYHDIHLTVPQPKCNAPWIMQSLSMEIQAYYGTTNMSNPMVKIYKQILRNTTLWINSNNPNDNIIVAYTSINNSCNENKSQPSIKTFPRLFG